MSGLTRPLRPLPEPPDATELSSELASVRVDRACSELRHGRPIALQDPGDAGCCIAAAVETLSPARLQALLRLSGGRLRLLLTAERLQAMGWADSSTPRALALVSPITAEQVQLLCAVTPGCVDPSLLGEAEPAGPAMLAAITLCKRARLTPALLVAELPASQGSALDAALVHRLSTGEVMLLASQRAWALQRVSDARVPIAAHHDCKLVLFREVDGDAEHVAIIVGQPVLHEPVPVRLHSSCLTGDLLGSLRCDCGDQLRRAIDHLAVAGGVLLYLAQEGRGTGLANKLRAYRLQDGGLDTLQADRYLGFREDERDFHAAAAMLQALGIARIQLLTNNPHKIDALRDAGIEVVDRVPLLAEVNSHNARYVQTKHDHAGHLRADESHG
jgi:GTP cyclohydrolase II